MVDVLCALCTGMCAIFVALIEARAKKRAKLDDARNALMDHRDEQRAKENRLQMRMASANLDLTVGVAMALKRGHCNGEVEAGLKAVKAAQADYQAFIEELATEHLMTR